MNDLKIKNVGAAVLLCWLVLLILAAPAAAQTTPYEDCARTPLASAKEGDQTALREDGLCLIAAGSNYIEGGERRLKRAAEIDEQRGPPIPEAPEEVQLPAMRSGLDVPALLGPKSIPPSSAPDVVGAFRFLCGPGHLSYDDPVVYPGQEGAAHLHQFFGNLTTDAHSTYESLRQSGESTCGSDLNRSAYWIPAMLDGRGNVVRPIRVAVYYKRRPAFDPWFAENDNIPAVIPRGLRYVFGWDQTRAKQPQEINRQWKCVRVWTPVSTSGDMSHALAKCGPGEKLFASINSPDCWDGKNLDAPDHRSHMANEKRAGSRTFCPASHPYVLPQFTLTIEWEIEKGDDTSLWYLASDHMLPADSPRGGSLHSDWFGAWEDSVLLRWHAACVDRMLNCSDGDLGDGQIMRRNEHYPSEDYDRLVPVPGR